MKTEQELANELDAFLAARLKGQPAQPIGDVQKEAHLANALFDLAASAEPDPIFLSDLEARLARAASRQQKQKQTPERPSFWEQIITVVQESFTMRRTVFALGTIVALIIVGIFAFNVLFPNDGTEPSAIANLPTLASEAVVPTVSGEGTAVPEAETSIAEVLPQPTPDTSNLAPLPGLNSGGFGGGGGGFGGGGGEITASAPVTDANGDLIFRPYDPLSGTIYVMNATLPLEPAFAPVYEQPGGRIITLEDVRRFADLFRMSGPIYSESYPVFESPEGEPAWTPPVNYFIFDGSRTLSAWESNLQYYDQGATVNFTADLMAFEQALPIAEAFLRDRGLLDFEYQIVPPQFNGNEINFHRLVNGRLVSIAEYTVTVTEDGQILSVYYNPLNQLQALGEYPLRSAEAVWQQITTEGIDYQHSYFFTYPGPGYEFPEEPVPADDLYKYWQRTYEDGQAINVYSSPLVYKPVESDIVPRISADQFTLAGSDDVLRAIGEQAGKQLRLAGTVRHVDGTLVLEVTDWQVVDFIDYQYQLGTIRLSEGQTLFEADSGETFLIPNAPDDLADGERVNVNGWSIEPGDPYRSFNWQGIDRYVDWEALATESGPASDFIEPYQIGQVEISSVELVYVYVPVAPEGGELYFLLQPAWRFKGSTDTNEIIEFIAQAVTEEFLVGNE
ncbi:MAG: hypothetical protein H6658_00185 [Ardenticatenaceae bacterium]|nr:hypothetical protein [Ardenticatenaceae bacterium]